MTPQQFVAKWQAVELSERSACQQHFLDLCELLGQPKPAEADPEGAWYTFERGVRKSEGGSGWADVWMKGHFGWEYKGKLKNLAAAYRQLLLYREDLENPPLLVVCDMDRFEIHTNFTGTLKTIHAFDLNELGEPKNLDVLRKLFTDPNALKPGVTAEVVTEQAADLIGQLADGMRNRDIPAPQAAHFLMKLMFCMFAEDINLLPNKVFTRIMETATKGGAKGLVDASAGQKFARLLRDLFEAMSHGGMFGTDEILHFNGGLFSDAEVIDLTPGEMLKLRDISRLDWGGLEPSIFGTLFERTLDPEKRSKIGAHYTSRQDIVTLLDPVVMQPLRREWAKVKCECEELTSDLASAKTAAAKRKKIQQRDTILRQFVERLAHVTVLDPACGSGNFLYVALHLLLDFEKEVISFASRQGIGLLPQVRPTQLAGIEINAYAQELASVVIWIGYLQWMHYNGFNAPSDPVLEPIESIRRMDAILDQSDPQNPKEPEWPNADFIVGNPPFLGDKMMRGGLGDDYVNALRLHYADRIPGQSDLCCYWFELARNAIQIGKCRRAGLLATQGVRGGANRRVLERINDSGSIFWAVSDRDWILDGATVHVSMIGFDDGTEATKTLDGEVVSSIHSNLRSGSKCDVTTAKSLSENQSVCYLGVMKAGSFDIDEAEAVLMLHGPNAHRVPNSDVLRPRLTARDILQRADIGWIVDFGCAATAEEASCYEMPWKYVETHVRPERVGNRRRRLAEHWWIHGEPRPGLRKSLLGLSRFIVTPEVSKHRVFVWLDSVYLADHQTRAFAFDDDCSLGVLHSRVHEVWSRSQGTQLRERESGFRYTPSTCFETFPFPYQTESQRSVVAATAKALCELRSNWLNPPDWTKTEELEFPGSADGPWNRYIDTATVDNRGIGTVRYPRLVPMDADCATKLKRRTLTNLYNERPTWLDLAHRKLDEAVFAAYGWPVDLSDDELLARLLELNLSRASQA